MKLFWRSTLFAVIACFSPLAFGQSVDWTNTGPDTNFSNGANWTTSQSTGTVPGSGDSTHIFPGFTTVADPANSQINVQAVGGSTLAVTINSSTDQSVRELLVSSNFNSNAYQGTLNLNFTGGSFLNVATGDALFLGGVTTNFSGIISMGNGNFVVGTTSTTIDVGQVSGPGAFNLNSGLVNYVFGSVGEMIVGQGTVGTMTQTGTSTVNATGVPLLIGDVGGTGTYALNGTSKLFAGNIFVGAGSGSLNGGATAASSGILTLSSTSTSALIADNLILGSVNGGGAFSGITGTVSQTAGTATIAGTVAVASSASSIGTYSLSGTSSILNAAFIIIGSQTQSAGDFNQSGGQVNTTDFGLVIGNSGTGTYELSGGSISLTGTSEILDIGASAGGTGTMTQTGGTVTTGDPSNSLFVGDSGNGTYNLSGGTLTTTGAFGLGVSGGTGVFNYTGGTLNIGAGLSISSTGTFNQGANLTLSNPATQQIFVDVGGIYNLNSGTLTASGNNIINGGGTFNLKGGTLDVGGSNTITTSSFNFSGGTVAVTGSDWTNASQGIVSGQSTIDTTGGNATLSGNLTGSGTFALTGGNNLTFSGTNNVGTSWGVNIQNGTVNATTRNLSATGTLSIASGSTLNLNATGNGVGYTDTFAGTISGDGNLNTGSLLTTGNPNPGPYMLVLSGTTALTSASTTTMADNTGIEVGSGTFGTVAGGAGTSFVVGGVSGGTVSLLNNATAGTFTVNSTSTLLASNITGDVTNLGALGSNATLGNVLDVPTLTINGSLNSSNLLIVRVNVSTADQFTTTSTSTLSGLVDVVNAAGTTRHLIVDSPNGITIGGNGQLNDAGGLELVSGSSLISSSLSVDDPLNPTKLYLDSVQGLLSPYAQTPNQTAVALALDPLTQHPSPAFAPLLATLNSIPTSQIPTALDQLSPESLQYSSNIAFENATFLAQQMNGAMANLRAGYRGFDSSGLSMVAPGLDSSLARSLGSLLAYNAPSFNKPAPNGVNYYPQDSAAGTDISGGGSSRTISDSPNPILVPTQATPNAPYTTPAQDPSAFQGPYFSEFIAGNFVLADLNQNQSAANAPSSKASYTAANATAGVAFRMTSKLAAGVLFNYNHTDAKTDSYGSKTTVNSYSPGIYGTYFDKGFYANGLFAFGYNTYSNNRNIPLTGTTANSSPAGQQYVTNLDFGYDFKRGNWTFGPTLGATYTHLNVDSFNESGAGAADLAVNSQSVDSLRSRLGGHVSYVVRSGSIVFQPTFTAMWQHEYLADSSGITSQFSGLGTNSFTIQTAAPSRDSALLGCGLTATLENYCAFYVNYLADVGADNYYAQSIEGGVKARF